MFLSIETLVIFNSYCLLTASLISLTTSDVGLIVASLPLRISMALGILKVLPEAVVMFTVFQSIDLAPLVITSPALSIIFMSAGDCNH